LEGGGGHEFSLLYFEKRGGRGECFLFYFGSWVAFRVITHICFALVCKLVVKIQSSFILFTYMGESDGQNTRGKLLFLIWFARWLWRSKRSFLASPCGQNTKCKFLFWFSLQSRFGGAMKFYSFHLHHGYATCTDN
jgi:hypothetical protein